jgi:hypothetical protein
MGAPFTYAEYSDSSPFALINNWVALAGNVLLLVLVSLGAVRVWCRTKTSTREAVTLLSFATIYMWANRQPWGGWKQSLGIWNLEIVRHTSVYGFPFTYAPWRIGGPDPLILYADFLFGLLIVLAIHATYGYRVQLETASA